jgi:hypothetical protein
MMGYLKVTPAPGLLATFTSCCPQDKGVLNGVSLPDSGDTGTNVTGSDATATATASGTVATGTGTSRPNHNRLARKTAISLQLMFGQTARSRALSSPDPNSTVTSCIGSLVIRGSREHNVDKFLTYTGKEKVLRHVPAKKCYSLSARKII